MTKKTTKPSLGSQWQSQLPFHKIESSKITSTTTTTTTDDGTAIEIVSTIKQHKTITTTAAPPSPKRKSDDEDSDYSDESPTKKRASIGAASNPALSTRTQQKKLHQVSDLILI